MYGMIHQALREMALEHLDEQSWNMLLRHESHSKPLFIGMEYYTDETTIDLVHLVAQRLDMPMDTALQELGRVWINFAAKSEYGRILRMAGDDLETFLENLDRMHASIRSNMPKAEMPSFELIAATQDEMQVRYRSVREGLAPLVMGILLEVADRFEERVTITYQPEGQGALFFIHRKGSDA